MKKVLIISLALLIIIVIGACDNSKSPDGSPEGNAPGTTPNANTPPSFGTFIINEDGSFDLQW